MPKAFSVKEKKLIHDRLMEQGERLFATYGLRKTSIEELTTAVGISKAAFYIFFESKEALFMDLVEQAEQQFRQKVLAAVNLPGESPRARLVAVLKKAFTLWKTIPLLQIFTRSDYERLSQRVSLEKIQEHMLSDQEFIEALVARCWEAGIPIQAPADKISGLMYALFLTILHEDDLGPGQMTGTLDLLLELVAAYCLGEVEIQDKGRRESQLSNQRKDHQDEPAN